MSTLEKCLRILRALDPGFFIDIQFTTDGKFQIGGTDADHEVIYEIDDGDSPEEAIENLWKVLKEQVERRGFRQAIDMIDEER